LMNNFDLSTFAFVIIFCDLISTKRAGVVLVLFFF
jgi:hypothetical protein